MDRYLDCFTYFWLLQTVEQRISFKCQKFRSIINRDLHSNWITLIKIIINCFLMVMSRIAYTKRDRQDYYKGYFQAYFMVKHFIIILTLNIINKSTEGRMRGRSFIKRPIHKKFITSSQFISLSSSQKNICHDQMQKDNQLEEIEKCIQNNKQILHKLDGLNKICLERVQKIKVNMENSSIILLKNKSNHFSTPKNSQKSKEQLHPQPVKKKDGKSKTEQNESSWRIRNLKYHGGYIFDKIDSIKSYNNLV